MKIELADGRSLLKLNSTVVPGGLRHAGIVEKVRVVKYVELEESGIGE